MSKIVELTLKVQGAETLEEMAASAKELEAELRRAGKSAEGFSKGMSQLTETRGELKEFRQLARGIEFSDQIAAVTKFTNGFVSGFALMKTAMMAFGSEGSESIEKVVKTLGMLMTSMQALQGIAEAFDGGTLTSLKTIGASWSKLVTSIKTGSAVIKASLIGTGILAIVVALGLILANWEKIVNWGKIALGLQKDIVKESEKNVAYLEKVTKLEESRLKTFNELAKITGDQTESLRLQYQLNTQNLSSLMSQLVIQQQLNKEIGEDINKVGVLRTLWAKLVGDFMFGIAEKKKQQIIDDKLLKNAQEYELSQQNIKNIASEIILARVKQVQMENELIGLAIHSGDILKEQPNYIKEQIEYARQMGTLSEDALLLAKMRKEISEQETIDAKNKISELEIYADNEAKIAGQKYALLGFELRQQKDILQVSEETLIIDKEKLTAAQDAYDAVMRNKKATLEQVQAADANLQIWDGIVTAEEDAIYKLKLQINELAEQRKIILLIEDERKRIQELDDFKFNREIELKKLLEDQALTTEKINQYMQQQAIAMDEIYRVSQLQSMELEKQQQSVEIITQGFDDYISKYDELNNVADIYTGKLDDFIASTVDIGGGIRVTAEAYNELIGLQALSNEDLELSVKYYTELLEMQNQKVGKQDEDIKLAAQQLALVGAITDATIKQLEAKEKQLLIEKQGLQETLAGNKLLVKDAEDAVAQKEEELAAEKKYVDELKTRGVKGRELAKEQEQSLLRQKQLENEILKLKGNVVAANNNVADTNRKIEDTDIAIRDVNVQINKELDKKELKTRKINQNLQQELKINDKIADWWKRNGEEIEGVINIMNQGLELIGVGFQNTITNLNSAYQQMMLDSQAKIDALKLELDQLNEGFEDSSDELEELLEMREDADGERLLQIDAEIAALQNRYNIEKDEIKAKENEIIRAENAKAIAETAYKNKIAQAEHKNAVWQKANNIINAISQGVLAVLKAAPNPVLMAIAGVLAAGSVATIAAQKIPPPLVYPPPVLRPEIKAEGGMITGDKHTAPSGGVPILAEGGEWIAPRWMVNDKQTSPLISALENFRVKRYAEGGTVQQAQPLLQEARQTAVIDYDLLAQKLSDMKIWVSVAEIRDVDRRFVNTIYKGSSI